ncbi:hypothetical protein V6N13_137707 [Hibiscus sabdariffa]
MCSTFSCVSVLQAPRRVQIGRLWHCLGNSWANVCRLKIGVFVSVLGGPSSRLLQQVAESAPFCSIFASNLQATAAAVAYLLLDGVRLKIRQSVQTSCMHAANSIF